MLNLASSMLITMLTYTAEIGGVALAVQLVASVNELLIVPVVAILVWLVLWQAKFSIIENVFGFPPEPLVRDDRIFEPVRQSVVDRSGPAER
jgi:hydrogenase-4 membrane subunit HyfE